MHNDPSQLQGATFKETIAVRLLQVQLIIGRLTLRDGERLRALRLRSLRDAPDAFGTTVEEAATWPAETWNHQLAQLATFVASADGTDVGMFA
jgi:hypothetical protein